MKYRLVYVCGGIPESKEPANRLICKKCSEVALRNMYACWLPEARRITSGDLQRLCAKLTQKRGRAPRSKGKSYTSACLHTANACSYILNLQLYIWGQIHLSIMIWAESLADAWSACLCHGIDKRNVVLTIKAYEWKEKRDAIRAGYCNMSKFNDLHHQKNWNHTKCHIRKKKYHALLNHNKKI